MSVDGQTQQTDRMNGPTGRTDEQTDSTVR